MLSRPPRIDLTVLALWLSSLSVAFAQTNLVTSEIRAVSELPTGFSRVSGKYIDVITDMPLNEDLRELTKAFDAAIPQWCQVFALSEATVAEWHVEAYVMLDRARFQAAGLIPQAISGFKYGFQLGDRIWVTEQQSAYYRRHLLLHEGTHWMMARKYGRQGPPWLMEGMAEWLGTHRWDGIHLKMGVIPRTREEAAYWGRTKIIQQQLADGVAPSLESILRYSDIAHQDQDAYAWSWAAVLFLKHHPSSSDTFDLLLKQPMQGRDDVNRWLFKQLQTRWPHLRREWNAAITDFDYGYDLSRGMLGLSKTSVLLNAPKLIQIDSAKGWQASGILVSSGSKIQIHAEGNYIVGREPKPWNCQPNGVTLEYFRGLPLGRLLMTIAPPIPQEPDFSLPLSSIAVGADGEITIAESGELHFRINESIGGLADNEGTLNITISP